MQAENGGNFCHRGFLIAPVCSIKRFMAVDTWVHIVEEGGEW